MIKNNYKIKMSQKSNLLSREIIEDIAFSLKFDLIEERDLLYILNTCEKLKEKKSYHNQETIKLFNKKVKEFCQKNCDKLSNRIIKDERMKEKFKKVFELKDQKIIQNNEPKQKKVENETKIQNNINNDPVKKTEIQSDNKDTIEIQSENNENKRKPRSKIIYSCVIVLLITIIIISYYLRNKNTKPEKEIIPEL